MKIALKGRAGMKIRAGDGGEDLNFPEMMSTPLFYKANTGDRLVLLDSAYKFNVATYSPEVEPRWIYTYDYAPSQSWTVYRRDLNANSYRSEEYIFNGKVYFRVCLRKVDGTLFDGAEDINRILSFETSQPFAEKSEKKAIKPWLEAEVRRVAQKIHVLRQPDELTFALLTDTHYTVNGTWDDTAASIGAVHAAVSLDGIIHLGDLTDGMVTGDVTRYYVKNMLDGLKSCGVPVWVTLGNHDSNYFKNNPEPFPGEEQSRLYLDREESAYHIDFAAHRLRLIFLDSFDHRETLRYGYRAECALWLGRTLADMPGGWLAVVFSHIPPMTRLQYWTKEVRGEAALMAALNGGADAAKVLAFINGHNHADRFDNGNFPIISIANAKCEAFTEYKTAGFVTPERRLGDASQELWDVVLVNTARASLRFVRFGAGRDRIISNGRAEWA